MADRVNKRLPDGEWRQVARLSCEYVEKMRAGEEPDLRAYLAAMPSQAARDTFVVSTNMSLLMLAASAMSSRSGRADETPSK